jgi:drug/metabolite transporter (DMT)-like permease
MGNILGLVAALAWGTSDFLGGRFATRYPALTVGFISQATSFALLLGVLLLVRPEMPASALAWGVAAGVFTSLGGVALYQGLATGDSAVVAPLSACGAIVPVAFAVATGDVPSTLQSVGIALAFLGIIFTSLPRDGLRFTSSVHLRPVLFGAGAAIGFGMFFVLVDAGASNDSESLTVLTAARFAGTVVVGSIAMLLRQLMWPGRNSLPIAGSGAIEMTAIGSFALASTRGNLAVASVLASLYPIQTLVLSRYFTDERFTRLRLLGAGLALAGVACISVG